MVYNDSGHKSCLTFSSDTHARKNARLLQIYKHVVYIEGVCQADIMQDVFALLVHSKLTSLEQAVITLLQWTFPLITKILI
jgi:hypothetical protein